MPGKEALGEIQVSLLNSEFVLQGRTVLSPESYLMQATTSKPGFMMQASLAMRVSLAVLPLKEAGDLARLGAQYVQRYDARPLND